MFPVLTSLMLTTILPVYGLTRKYKMTVGHDHVQFCGPTTKCGDILQPSQSKTQSGSTSGAAGHLQIVLPREREVERVHPSGPASESRWDHCVARDNSRVQYGHTFVQNQYVAPGEERHNNAVGDPVQRFMDALMFDHMGSRYDSIDTAHMNTCRWVFQKEQYLRWMDSEYREKHHGFLWIKGKAGSGKSTIMKCALEHAKDAPMRERDSIIFFFFNARGHEMERSVEGMYRSLLSQILTQFPVVRSRFSTVIPHDGRRNDLPVIALKNYLHKAVSFLEKGQAMSIYIDASMSAMNSR